MKGKGEARAATIVRREKARRRWWLILGLDERYVRIFLGILYHVR